MNNILVVFDTSFGSANIGDYIIAEAVNCVLKEILEGTKVFILRISSHSAIPRNYRNIVKESAIKLIIGTNLFHFHYGFFRESNGWKIGLKDLDLIRGIVLFGVGTQIIRARSKKFRGLYSMHLNFRKLYSTYMWKRILNNQILHSVRDEESVQMIHSLGLRNVVNTGCPTLWRLTETHCQEIPKSKSKNVVCTFTDYNKSIDRDIEILKILSRNYNKIYVWPQGSGDFAYIKKLISHSTVNIQILPPSLDTYDDLLSSEIEIDYVGTRLHGGIRALQFKRRTIIISVDNRAESFGKTFNLTVLPRNDLSKLEPLINSKFVTSIKLNWSNINEFKNSLRNYILKKYS